MDPQRCGCVGVAFCVNRNLSLPGIFNVWMMTHLDLQIEPEAVCFFFKKIVWGAKHASGYVSVWLE